MRRAGTFAIGIAGTCATGSAGTSVPADAVIYGISGALRVQHRIHQPRGRLTADIPDLLMACHVLKPA